MTYDWPEWRKIATVRAIQINGPEDLPDDERILSAPHGGYHRDGQPEDVPDWGVTTLEGDHYATWGDYLCQGIEDELWPVKQSIFERTYAEAISWSVGQLLTALQNAAGLSGEDWHVGLRVDQTDSFELVEAYVQAFGKKHVFSEKDYNADKALLAVLSRVCKKHGIGPYLHADGGGDR